jgi:hypothetical protein
VILIKIYKMHGKRETANGKRGSRLFAINKRSWAVVFPLPSALPAEALA